EPASTHPSIGTGTAHVSASGTPATPPAAPGRRQPTARPDGGPPGRSTPPGSGRAARGRLLGGAGLDHLVDDPVLQRLLGGHDEVAVGVAGDLLDVLAGLLGEDLVEEVADPLHLTGGDLDVGRLALGAAVGLVDQDPRVRQREAL